MCVGVKLHDLGFKVLSGVFSLVLEVLCDVFTR